MKLFTSVVLVSMLVASQLSAKTDSCKDLDIQQGVKAVSDAIPLDIDDITTLSDVGCKDNVLYYTYDLKDSSKRKISALNDGEMLIIRGIMKKNLKRDYCEKMQDFHDRLDMVVWHYHSEGKELFSIAHDKRSCER